jgi:phenylacetate-CoA ligase
MSALRDWTGRAAVGAIDRVRRIRGGTRVAEGHYIEGRRLRREARQWSAAQRESWMLAQLRRAVRHAAETPFYRARFRDAGFDPASDFTFDDYARLPILERADVSQGWEAMLSSRVAPADRRKDGTGGSTGTPLSYFSGPEERGWRLSGQDDFMAQLGLRRGESMAYLWGHHIDQRERETARERVRDLLMNRRWFDCFRLSPEVLQRYHQELTDFMPNGLLAYASALDALATELLSRGLTATYPARRLVTGAEKLWPAQRARIQQAFAAPLHEQYGSREIGLVAAQHGDPSRSLALDVDWANLLVEPEGAGPEASIIVTKLHADAMPMLRYRIGDQAHFGGHCRPGHPVFQLEEVLGRQLDGLHLPDGRWVHGVGIPHMMKDLPVREFQIRQAADYSIEVSIVPGADYTPDASARIAQVLGDNLPGIPIRVRTTDAIPRSAANKWRPVITDAVAARTPSPSPTHSS